MKSFIVSKENAIQNLRPDAQFVWRGTNYSGLEWLSEDQTKPTESEIQEEITRLEEAEPSRLLRVDRDRLLAATDWTGLSDTALTNEQAAKWKLYRQKLRDLPKGLTTPAKVKNVKWPTKP